MVATIDMSENAEALKKCSHCDDKYPLKDWKAKPNGELYHMCEFCRIIFRDKWRKNSIENNVQKREKYADDVEFREKSNDQRKIRYHASNRERTTCPDCAKEMYIRSLHTHVKCCKGRKPEV
jgi:hypothetical protein